MLQKYPLNLFTISLTKRTEMKSIFAFIITLISSLLWAQYHPETESANVLPYWQKGDNFEYFQNEKEYQVNKNDTLIKKNITFDLSVNILEKTDDSFTIEWIIKQDFAQLPEAIRSKFSTQLGAQKFVYKTNAEGVFINLLNFDDIVEYNKKMVEILGTSIQNEKDKEAFKTALEKVFGNENVTEQLIASKINTYHLFYGSQIKKNKPTKSKFESVNPVTKNKIVYNRSFLIEDFNEEDQTYSLYSETMPVKNNLLDEVKSTLEKIISKEAKDMDHFSNFDYISKVFQATHNSGVVLYQIKRDFIDIDEHEIIKELEFILK